VITAKDVDNAAKLARLRLSDDERARMVAELEKIVAYVDELFAADVDDAAPLERAPGVEPRARVDEARAVLGRAALAGNPGFDGTLVKVPRVV
jgi:aspartyl/glutamyl-tRNA(Asn/Gln) amidotransferase C subunit